jgi:hypothetical protein
MYNSFKSQKYLQVLPINLYIWPQLGMHIKINSLILITTRRYLDFRVNIFLYFVIKYKFTGRPNIFRDLVIFIFYIGNFAI